MSTELKPCPFCGGDKMEIWVHSMNIRCLGCGAESPTVKTREIATEAWNTRKLPAEALEDIKSAVIGLSNGKGSVPMIISMLRGAYFRSTGVKL